eukprot:494804_1
MTVTVIVIAMMKKMEMIKKKHENKEEKKDNVEKDKKDDEQANQEENKPKENEQKEKEEQYEEQLTVQVHEIYASIWSNQKITLQFIDVLSCINPIHLRKINKVWRKQNIQFIDCFGLIMQKVLKQLKELLEDLSPQENKPKEN